MVALWILLGLIGLLLILALLPVQITIRHHQENERGRFQYTVRIGPATVAAASTTIGEVAAEEPRTVRKVERKLPDFVPKSVPGLIDWARPAIDYFRHRIRFRQIQLAVVVGGLDAMESALLAGMVWTLTGVLGSILSHLFVLPPGIYRVKVQPSWQEPVLGLNVDCMLTFRVGHAIWAGVLLVPQALKSARAARRRQRQKGEVARG